MQDAVDDGGETCFPSRQGSLLRGLLDSLTDRLPGPGSAADISDARDWRTKNVSLYALYVA